MGIIADRKRCYNSSNVSCLESNTQFKMVYVIQRGKEAHQKTVCTKNPFIVLWQRRLHSDLLILLPFLTDVTSLLRSDRDTNNAGIVRRAA